MKAMPYMLVIAAVILRDNITAASVFTSSAAICFTINHHLGGK